MIAAVVFDLDGVLIDSEQVWDEVREDYVRAEGGRWSEGATRTMMGMSAPEWSAYLHDALGVAKSPEEINGDVVGRIQDRFASALPLLPGATEAVGRLAARWPLALASSSNRSIIDAVLTASGLRDRFAVVVSSEEVARGKPAPDVYLEAVRQLGVEATAAVAIEDSTNGLRAAHAAGLHVIAVPNAHFPPDPAAVALADLVVDTVADLQVEAVERVAPD